MIKVILADDEIKICQLIYKLVNWEELGMQVTAVVHNGIAALEAIEKIQPDIVITDIRMPGYDGLEMIQRAKEVSIHTEYIIISGYRHFEYAKSAIKYGVKDYLLKPIKQNELTEALKRIRNLYFEKMDQLSREEQDLIAIKNNLDKLRNAFFTEILFKNRIPKEELVIHRLNQEYHYHFESGIFQMILIKMDGLIDTSQSYITYFQEKVIKSITKYMTEFCIENESIVEESVFYIIINYQPKIKKNVHKILKNLLDELSLQKDIFENLHFTIGVGMASADIIGLSRSLKTARWAIEQRLVLGVDKIIEGEDVSLNKMADSTVFYEFNKKMTEGLERLDETKISESFGYLQSYLMQKEQVTGHEIIQMCKEAINLYLLTMRKNKIHIKNEESIFETWVHHIENIGDPKGIISYLSNAILESFQLGIADKRQEVNRPVREAKKYIEEHFKEPISLEIVSDYVGFNTNYFSSLFKKEAGLTFLEYLTEVRMKKAKELLQETNMNVATICEEVGYSDSKYFTKCFTKYTNLKPNQYRKIYS